MSRRKILRALPLLILLGGLVLRLYRLGTESLWYDETVSLLLARDDLAELIRHTAGDIHPPFYYLLLHFWGQFVGWSEFSSAFLSVYFGILLIALVYRVAREWSPFSAGRRLQVAAIAAFLVALSPYNVAYSQEVRMYTLGAVLGLASVYLALRMLAEPRVLSRYLLAYVVVTALGIYTLYYFIFLIGFEYVCIGALLWARLKGKRTKYEERKIEDKLRIPKGEVRIKNFAVSQFALVILYLPWLPVAFRQATDPPVPPWRTFVPPQQALTETLSALVLGQSVPLLPIGLLLLIVLALAVSLFAARKSSNGADMSPTAWSAPALGLFLLGYTLIPFLAIYLFSPWMPLYHVRYIFTYSPGFYILIALALVVAAGAPAARRMRPGPVLVAGALLVLTLGAAYSLDNFWFDPQYADDDLRGAVQHIAENWRPGDVILVNAGYAYPALSYYYPDAGAPRVRLRDYRPVADDAASLPIILTTGSIGGRSRLGWGDPRSDFYATTAEETISALDRVFASHPRVWMLRVYDTVTDPDGLIREYLNDHAQLIDDLVVGGTTNIRVQGFLTQKFKTLPAAATRLNAQLADRVTLLGFEAKPPRAGDFFDAALYWQPRQALNYNYQLSLQVLDGAGQAAAAPSDETPLGDALPTSRWRPGEIYREPVRVRLPEGLAPGDYSIIVKLYNLNSGEVLGEPIQLLAFSVGR